MSSVEIIKTPEGIFSGARVRCIENFFKRGQLFNKKGDFYEIRGCVYTFIDGDEKSFSVKNNGLWLTTDPVDIYGMNLGCLLKLPFGMPKDNYFSIGITREQFETHFRIEEGDEPLNV